MLRVTVEALVEIVSGQLVAGDPSVMLNGLAIDSRQVEPGSIFVALAGERVDGHAFVADAARAGARCAIVTAPDDVGDGLSDNIRDRIAIVRVEDALGALHALARHHRSRLACQVLGVTGSTGKTTTKDFLTACLSPTLKTVATRGNQNNEIGVPLTVFRAGADTDVLVVEMGMRGLGQIAQLCEIARPDAGLVTNVGTSHIEVLGDEDAIFRAKSELVEAIPSAGAVFLNGDDGYSARMAALSAAPVVFYGTSPHCSVRAEDITIDNESKPSFVMITPRGRASVTLPLPGRHNVYNALAAAAIADRLELPLDSIAASLSDARVTDMRMQLFQTANEITVLNDAYNASPTSVKAALDTLAGMGARGRRVAVLGDMAELGSLTELAHFQLGEYVSSSAIDVLVTVGPKAMRIAEGARAAGMDDTDVRPCVTVEEAIEVLDDTLDPGDVVLVKASRVMGLERVVEGIVDPRV